LANPVDVTVLDTVGVSLAKSLTKSARALVFGNFPTNMVTKPHLVFWNKFGSLSEAHRATMEEIDDGSWDNCGIRTWVVGPTPIFPVWETKDPSKQQDFKWCMSTFQDEVGTHKSLRKYFYRNYSIIKAANSDKVALLLYTDSKWQRQDTHTRQSSWWEALLLGMHT
jgi:hypothetical protein